MFRSAERWAELTEKARASKRRRRRPRPAAAPPRRRRLREPLVLFASPRYAALERAFVRLGIPMPSAIDDRRMWLERWIQRKTVEDVRTGRRLPHPAGPDQV